MDIHQITSLFLTCFVTHGKRRRESRGADG
jgi:hypothetical protein